MALFRALLGLLLIGNLISRWKEIPVFYTDSGVLPRIALNQSPFPLSLHALSGSATYEQILFIIALVFAIFLTFGFKTKAATILCWFLTLSLYNRNPFIDFGMELLLAMLLWSVFLPLGAVFSIDSFHQKKNSSSNIHFGAASIAFILQLVMLYVMVALLRTSPEWRTDGTAIYYALNNYHTALDTGISLLKFPQILKPITLIIYYFEAFGTFLLFVPEKKGFIRLLTVCFFILMHFSYGIFLKVALFPYISIVVWTAILPSFFWDKTAFFFNKLQSYAFLLRAKNLIGSIAKNLSFFYRPSRLPLPNLPILTKILTVCLFSYIFLQNLSTLPNSLITIPTPIKTTGQLLGINQKWVMFAPEPPFYAWWYILPAHLTNGVLIDVFTNHSPSWTIPQPATAFNQDVWSIYLGNLVTRNKDARKYFLAYVCRNWNANHDRNSQIKNLSFAAVYKPIILPSSYNQPKENIPLPLKAFFYETSCK